MRRWLGWIAIGWLLAVCAVALILYGGGSSRPSLTDQTRAIALQLRCLVCQGESVADSPSSFSADIRAAIMRRLRAGQSPDQIKSALVRSYGDRILLAPPASGVGALAWLGPPLLLLGGAGLLVTLVVDWRSRGRRQGERAGDLYLARVRAELAALSEGEQT